MKLYISILAIIFTATLSIKAEAVTIRNKCGYPVAGSLIIADNNVSIAQFRVIPGEKIHLLKHFAKRKLVLRAIPDNYKYEDISISSKNIDTPNCYIELKCSDNEIKIKVD